MRSHGNGPWPLVVHLIESLGADGMGWSGLEASPGPGAPVVVVDTFRDLPGLYGLGTVAFVGSLVFGRAGFGHNIVEPLLHGTPVVVGANVGQWRDLVDRLGRNGRESK